MTSALLLLKQHTEGLTSAEKMQFQSQYTTRQRNVGAGIAMALLLGGLGVHKFYLKEQGAGIAYALCGTIGWVIVVPPIIVAILSIVDAINMQSSVAKFNNALAREIKAEIDMLR